MQTDLGANASSVTHGQDEGEAREVPPSQVLTLHLVDPKSQCFLKFCVQDTLLASLGPGSARVTH